MKYMVIDVFEQGYTARTWVEYPESEHPSAAAIYMEYADGEVCDAQEATKAPDARVIRYYAPGGTEMTHAEFPKDLKQVAALVSFQGHAGAMITFGVPEHCWNGESNYGVVTDEE